MADSASAAPTAPQGEKKKGMCCACPDTKKARDECIVRNGDEKCKDFIEAHKVCLRSKGFDV
jgi:cytochrome c oxidase assembly protein subunit 17